MEQILKIDDSALLSKHIITVKDIEALLPTEVKEQVLDIRVMVHNGKPRWVIFLKGGGAYHYEPLNKDKEMMLDVSGIAPKYGRIYFLRKGRYLRYEESPEPEKNKYYTVFLCRPKVMILWREVKEFWFIQEPIDGPGFVWYTKWFGHFV